VLAVLAFRALRRPSPSRHPLTWAVGTVLVGAAAFLAVGLKFEPIQGDMWRFQMPIYPVLLLCVVLLASRDERFAGLGTRGSLTSRVAAFAAVAAVLAFALTTIGEVRTQIRGRWVYDRQQAGLALARFKHDGLKMFVSESGVLPLESGWWTTDLIGLNDRYIAEHGATLPYITSVNPDLVQFIVNADPRAGFRGHYRPFEDLIQTGRYSFATATVKTNEDLKPGVPPQAHLYFVRANAPHAQDVLATLRGLKRVRLLAPPITQRALAGLGYKPPPAP
jgi:hypothetical protein